MIEVSHLSKSYGSRPAVQDLSFTVPDGQIYGLLGPNGAGKSTIMNILTGYLAPTEGEVKVAGFRLPEQAQQAKACVGYLPEQPPLYPEMTVQEYLDFVAELKGVKRAQRKQQVLAAARRTGLEEVLLRVIRSLSKGYRQRVGIAQALLGSPQLIILDEPTVGLDPAQVIEIRNLIRELGKAHTVILSSHILSEVQAVCQQVLILSKGRLVAVGSPEELGETLNPGSRLRATAQGETDTVLAAVRSVPGICRPGAPQGLEPLMQAAQDGRLGLKMQNVELDFPRLEVRAMGAMGVRKDVKTFADFDVGVQIHPLDDELMKTRPDVVAVHDFVKDLVDSKALACRVKDECRARVTVEPDERGFGIIRSSGVDVTEKVMKFIFAEPAGTGEAG